MRVSRDQARENRERIVENASYLFRQRGFDGVGVADLMKAAGLTHGGFYGHFGSKEDLMAEAVEKALIGSSNVWSALEAEGGLGSVGTLVDRYVSAAHRDNLSKGCALAALGSDAARKPAAVKQSFERGLRRFADILCRILPGSSRPARREEALAVIAQMVGALMLARSVEDRELSGEILDSVRKSLHRRYPSGHKAKA